MAAIGQRGEAGERGPLFNPIDRALARLHLALFVRRKAGSVAGSALLYALVVLLLGERLAVSSNYFVFLPLLAAALAYGLPGGLAAGLLGLPSNLLLFRLIGHPEYSPASKPIAWIFGAAVGLSLGYLSDYFRKLDREAERRAATAASLAKALEEKELLLAELHHRVKNNLNVIKSVVQLQKNRSSDPDFLAAADDLMGRVLAIAQVHERLYGEGRIEAIEPRGYLEALVDGVIQSRTEPAALTCDIEAGTEAIPPETATPLALIVNEAVTNALKHGQGGGGGAAGLPEPPHRGRLLPPRRGGRRPGAARRRQARPGDQACHRPRRADGRDLLLWAGPGAGDGRPDATRHPPRGPLRPPEGRGLGGAERRGLGEAARRGLGGAASGVPPPGLAPAPSPTPPP